MRIFVCGFYMHCDLCPGQPFQFPCEDISDRPPLDHAIPCLCRTNSEPALLSGIPLCDALSSLLSCSDSYLKAKMYLKKQQSVVI